MLLGTPVLPLVGVMEQINGTTSTISEGEGGDTSLGGRRDSTRPKVETVRTPGKTGGSEEPNRMRSTLARLRTAWRTSGVHFEERKTTVRPESQIA